jgi:Xaa-Pro dipeptidase
LIVAKAVASKPKECVVLLEDHMPVGILWALEKAFGGFRKALSMTSYLESLRIVKSKDETDLMRKASRIIGDSVSEAMTQARLGKTELDVRQIVVNECIRNGGMPTFTTVQFGENTALPHADSGTKELRKGDIALFDCGCEVEGYNTDITRVAVAGKPSSEQESVYSVVLKAQQAAIDRIKAGLSCEKADSLARQVIEKAGYGVYFTHRLGHGVGLEVHEPPYLVNGNSMQLRAGMTHSVEPGIYLEGKFGVRIEDLVLVGDTGCEALTTSPKDLYRMNV